MKGHNERRFSVKFESPGPKLREIVLALRAIWDCWQNGTKLNFKGQFYRFDLMTPFFSPGPIEHPHIPVYIAGRQRRTCAAWPARCATACTCTRSTARSTCASTCSRRWRRACAPPAARREDFTYATAELRDHRRHRGRAGARRARPCKQQIAFYASTRTYEPVLAAHGWQDLDPAASTASPWRATGRAWPTSSPTRWSTPTPSPAPTTPSRRALQERYAGLLDRTAFYQPHQAGRWTTRAWPALVKEFNG